MDNYLVDTVKNFWTQGRRTRKSTSGWISGNAPCCVHNGESADNRGRGGLIVSNTGAINYHCFNCGYKASYIPGNYLSYRFRKLLSWLGADENVIRLLTFEALRVKGQSGVIPEPQTERVYKNFNLPVDAVSLLDSNDQSAIDYVNSRSINLNKYNFYVSSAVENNLNRRVIIPCYWKGALVGYTARSWDPAVKKKYYSQFDKNFIFNVDSQSNDWKFVIVCEGAFDAMSVDGVSVLGNEINEEQVDIIDSLGKEVIVVPDFDVKPNGKWSGKLLIEQAKEYNWTVSFPLWHTTCKDINAAVVKYGKLFTLQSILVGRVNNNLKIELLKRKLMAVS